MLLVGRHISDNFIFHVGRGTADKLTAIYAGRSEFRKVIEG